jgi:hypothetical protein
MTNGAYEPVEELRRRRGTAEEHEAEADPCVSGSCNGRGAPSPPMVARVQQAQRCSVCEWWWGGGVAVWGCVWLWIK